MKIKKITLLTMMGMFVLANFSFADNLVVRKQIKKVLDDKLIQLILKEAGDSTGQEHANFLGVVYSEKQSRDGKIRYDLLFIGVAGEGQLTVKYSLDANKVEELTKEEIQEAVLPCLGL